VDFFCQTKPALPAPLSAAEQLRQSFVARDHLLFGVQHNGRRAQ
jgi:hypothetical protein